ncbi:MAG: fumarate reductase subunit C [Rhizobacter sp.]|nr:fumarate reductase subunit C [Rhizobacter sp.]
MSKPADVRRPYVRPMAGWWRRDPFFMRYMLREATAVAVAVYAVVLALGIVRLAQGEAAWNGWLDALRSPWSLLLHAVLLVAMVIHAKSWFDIMPKTMPMILIGGRRLAAQTITRTGWAASVVASIVLFALAWWWGA